MTTLTLPTVFVILIGVVGRRGYGFALSLAGITGAGAAVFVGGLALPTFYATAIGAGVALALPLVNSHHESGPLPPSVSLLAALLGWATFVTFVAPLLFPGLETVTPTNAILTPGVLTNSNVAQIIYLGLGICVVVLVARDPRSNVGLIGVVVGGGILLSAWRYGNTNFGLAFPDSFFDNSPTLQYIETAAGGAARFRGIYSEPSALAGSCVVMIAYGVSRAYQVRGLHRVGLLALVGVAVYFGVVSTSTTFLVAGVAVVITAGLAFLFGFLARVTRLSAALGIAACLLVILAVWLLPLIAEFVQTAVQAKVSNVSYGERSTADSDSYAIFVNTWGFGVGLGSGRASSLLSTVLSTTGLIGALLLVAAVVALLIQTARLKPVRPAVWALVALLITKAIAGPDLSDPTGILWIALGLLSGAAMRATPPTDAFDPGPSIPAARTQASPEKAR